MIVATHLPHSWKIYVAITSRQRKTVGKGVLLQRISMLIGRLHNDTMIACEPWKVQRRVEQQLVGRVVVYDMAVARKEGLRQSRIDVLLGLDLLIGRAQRPFRIVESFIGNSIF